MPFEDVDMTDESAPIVTISGVPPDSAATSGRFSISKAKPSNGKAGPGAEEGDTKAQDRRLLIEGEEQPHGSPGHYGATPDAPMQDPGTVTGGR